VELVLTLRRGESVLITILVPAVLLIFFASLNLTPGGAGVGFLLPGMLALAIMATGMVSLGIATAYERHYGVLKRLGASPLPRWALLSAKTLSVLSVEALQVILLTAIAAILYQWRPSGNVLAAVAVLILGTIVFSALGLYMAGAWRAEATLAGANGLYLACLLLSGAVLPLDHLPASLQAVASVLPPAALTDALRGALNPGGSVPPGALVVLVVWAVVLVVLAVRTFQWE